MKRERMLSALAGLALTGVMTAAVLLQAGASKAAPVGGPYSREELAQLESEQAFEEEALRAQPAFRLLVRAEASMTAEVLRADGTAVQTLRFSGGEAAAGPLAPGEYELRAGSLRAFFTLAENASIRDVSGDGWTDGEILYFGAAG